MTTTANPGVSYAYEAYMQLLAALPDTPARTARAWLLDQMAGLADEIADVTYGAVADGDPSGDSLAWNEAASLVRSLAAAERGTVLVAVPAADEDEDGITGLWAELAAAATRAEQAAAAFALGEQLLDEGTRPHAYEAFAAAATGCGIGYPDSYPASA